MKRRTTILLAVLVVLGPLGFLVFHHLVVYLSFGTCNVYPCTLGATLRDAVFLWSTNSGLETSLVLLVLAGLLLAMVTTVQRIRTTPSTYAPAPQTWRQGWSIHVGIGLALIFGPVVWLTVRVYVWVVGVAMNDGQPIDLVELLVILPGIVQLSIMTWLEEGMLRTAIIAVAVYGAVVLVSAQIRRRLVVPQHRTE